MAFDSIVTVIKKNWRVKLMEIFLNQSSSFFTRAEDFAWYTCSTGKSTFLMKPIITSHVNYCASVGDTCWLIWNNVTSQMGQTLKLWRTEPQAEHMNSSHLFVDGTPSAGALFFLKLSNSPLVLNIFTSWREFNPLMAPNILRIWGCASTNSIYHCG